jgi:choline dehydrogenase-like flavoprotein
MPTAPCAWDPQAVVDATGAVRAVAGLSVADASIMPTPPSNPTMLTTMAIAEKVARDLRAEGAAARLRRCACMASTA